MCGIFGIVSNSEKQSSPTLNQCISALKRLEYRGYDSAGIATLSEGKIETYKQVGKVSILEEMVSTIQHSYPAAIAHTRWATHGKLTNENAHPHMDQESSMALVHNGIIENYYELKEMLMDHGMTFRSDTDSEVIVQLIAFYYQDDIIKALRSAMAKMKGSFALAIIHQDFPDMIITTARGCPLVIAVDKDNKKSYVSSDTSAFEETVLNVLFLGDDEIALVTDAHVVLLDSKGQKVENVDQHMKMITTDPTLAKKNGFDHYMLKEIYEQPDTILRALEGRMSEEFGTAHFDQLSIPSSILQSAHHVLLLACGTSWHAGCIAASMIEEYARVPAQSEIASEFRYTNPIVSENTLVIAISQSGETADTLAAVREAKAKGAKVLGICNRMHSTLAREADSCLFLNAGPEISVCSTKAFTSQLTVLTLLTLYLSRLRHMDKSKGQEILRHLKAMPEQINKVLALAAPIQSYAKKYAKFEHFFFLGRRYMFPTSLEAALKLKEISYLNATGYPAGEMKHGPIALASDQLAVIGMCGQDSTQEKTLSNLMEMKSRGANILAFVPEGIKNISSITSDRIYLPKDTLDVLSTIPYSIAAQLFAYYIAVERGCEIDQPRNLAKSVTVE